MDIALELCDTYIFDRFYAAALPSQPAPLSLMNRAGNWTLSDLKAASPWQFEPASSILSFAPGEAAYLSQLTRDDIYRQAFSQALISVPFMSILTVPFFLGEVRGYSKLYDSLAEEPFPYYNYTQFPLFILFTDFFIYLIHRGLHHPLLQSAPYHVFPFLFPLQKFTYLALFGFVQIWTVFIHDGEYIANSPVLNGAACHTMHHLYFNYNYGQYTTLWDRLGGSYRQPNEELFRRETKLSQKEWESQVTEIEKIVKDVEGEDDGSYRGPETVKKSI
ncbi:hypothetical protein DL95DRAFT_430441 [Leptodontidium sp. 2 PMI_412]|nr:hypothetical protein DL95DRAFT_430441 [Leptodontidium sp. 2 PMI_412]